jgi:Double zinc ribbon
MRCPRCQHENREGRRFCSKCGDALAAACPSCGFTNEPGDEFCGGCGARLGAEQPAQTKFTSPDIYTPKHLAEKILTSKAALEGERKQVTVLFADLKGSMEIAQNGLSAARQQGERGVKGQLLRLLGDIAAHPDRFEVDTAEAHYRQALTLAEELGLRPLLAHCHLGLGKLSRRTDKCEQARDHLHRDGDVPRHGHDLLAGESGGGDRPVAELTRRPPSASPTRT